MKKNLEHDDFQQRFQQCDHKFDTVFNLTSSASKVINSDLIILKVNKALTELMGYTAEELEGTKILDYACEEYIAHWHQLQKELWSNQRPFFKLDACLHRKDGSLAWVAVTTILYKENDETYGFTVLDDITAIKQYEEAERRLNTALKYNKTAVWEMDVETKTVIRSDGHDLLFGYAAPQHQWTLAHYLPHIWEEDRAEFEAAIEAVDAGQTMDIQARLSTIDNSLKWVNFQAKPATGANGRPIMLGTISDITKDKLIERHREDFISIASHELKTPVTSLKASLQLLDRLKNNLEPNLQTMITQANKSVNRITLLIDDLLNASRNLKDELKLRKTTFNINSVIEDCIQLVFNDTERVQLVGPKDLQLFADVERIERVLINLLTNAAKYAPEMEVTITITPEENRVKIAVTDNGPGIAPQKLPLLFDRYYQAEEHEMQYSGLGLGLFISAEIVRRHEGEIGVDSTLGEGSTFWFTIPFQH
jgi:PAS domain S-box-containing protein